MPNHSHKSDNPLGTAYPYLAMEKFGFTKQTYGLLLGTRQLAQAVSLLLIYLFVIKSRTTEAIVAQIGNVLFIIGFCWKKWGLLLTLIYFNTIFITQIFCIFNTNFLTQIFLFSF